MTLQRSGGSCRSSNEIQVVITSSTKMWMDASCKSDSRNCSNFDVPNFLPSNKLSKHFFQNQLTLVNPGLIHFILTLNIVNDSQRMCMQAVTWKHTQNRLKWDNQQMFRGRGDIAFNLKNKVFSLKNEQWIYIPRQSVMPTAQNNWRQRSVMLYS